MVDWERQFGDFEDFIDFHIIPASRLDPDSSTELEEYYSGDSKNPPHAIIQCNSRWSAEGLAETLSDWGAWVDVKGTEVYVEPYA